MQHMLMVPLVSYSWAPLQSRVLGNFHDQGVLDNVTGMGILRCQQACWHTASEMESSCLGCQVVVDWTCPTPTEDVPHAEGSCGWRLLARPGPGPALVQQVVAFIASAVRTIHASWLTSAGDKGRCCV